MTWRNTFARFGSLQAIFQQLSSHVFVMAGVACRRRRYHCMWLRESARHAEHARNVTAAARPLKAVKYHGKWPFTRLLGVQVPGDLALSLRNLSSGVPQLHNMHHLSICKLLLLHYSFISHYCAKRLTCFSACLSRTVMHTSASPSPVPEIIVSLQQEPVSVVLSAANFFTQAHCLVLFLRFLGLRPQLSRGSPAKAGSGGHSAWCEPTHCPNRYPCTFLPCQALSCQPRPKLCSNGRH